MIQQNFVDMEKMLELLEVNQSVSDHFAATTLTSAKGEVVFGKFLLASSLTFRPRLLFLQQGVLHAGESQFCSSLWENRSPSRP